VTLKLPAGYVIESLPAPVNVDMGALKYATTFEKSDDAVRLVRKQAVKVEIINRDKYPAVRAFFSKMAAADQEQIVLRKTNGSPH